MRRPGSVNHHESHNATPLRPKGQRRARIHHVRPLSQPKVASLRPLPHNSLLVTAISPHTPLPQPIPTPLWWPPSPWRYVTSLPNLPWFPHNSSLVTAI